MDTSIFFTGGFWLRISIILITSYILIQKDMNLKINFHSPLNMNINDEQSKGEEGITTLNLRLPDVLSGSPSFNFKTLSTSLFNIHQRKRTPHQTPKSTIVFSTHPPTEVQINAYINRFSNVAIYEMKKFKIPASIILANSLLHSHAGQSKLASSTNNHFKLPCESRELKLSLAQEDKCLKTYETPWLSFRDYSHYIQNNCNHLQQYSTQDYKSWAKGIEQSTVFNTRFLAKKLIQLIEKYQLNQYDQ